MKSLDYLFISKEPIPLECGLSIFQYSIKEIEDGIGLKRYENIVWSLTRYAYEFKFDLEDSGLDYAQLNAYDMFIILSQGRIINDIIEDLNFLFNDNFSSYLIESGHTVFVSNNGIFNSDSIIEIKSVLSKLMYLEKPKERKPANEQAKEMIKKQIKSNANKKTKYDLFSIMESLVWNKNSSETYDTILNRSVHQIYSGYRTIEKINNFDNTVNGLYAGVIDKDKINWESINWINKI